MHILGYISLVILIVARSELDEERISDLEDPPLS